MDERVWRLPGPRGFIRDIVAEHRRGRHVATVLPEALAADPLFTDGLAVALLDEFASQSVPARRIYDTGENGSVLDTFVQALIFENLPATIPELLTHDEARDMVAVVVAGDLRAAVRQELTPFLRRVELETHAIGQARHLSVVAVIERGQLPGFAGGASSDIAMTSIWWWARMARWDVAAHIAGLAGHAPLEGVLEDVRTESIVEVARWDLDLGAHLMASWGGEPGQLPALLKDWRVVPAPAVNGGGQLRADGLRPPDPILPFWDQRAIEGWHGQPSVAACSLATEPDKLGRLVWAAQARVLLPWIEERRASLHAELTAAIGAERMVSVLRAGIDPPVKADALVEIGVLDKVVRMTIGSAKPEWRDASRRLREARNSLAHLRPLSLGEQESLLATCRCLL